MRQTLVDEFSSIYIYNLRGNARTGGVQRQKEAGNAFGAGSRNTVAITFLVKKPGHTGPAVLHYRDIGDHLSREDKLAVVAGADLALLEWQAIEPNASGDWINQRGDVFGGFIPVGAKNGLTSVFHLYSGGVKTNRDAWVFNSSCSALESNIARMIAHYNSKVDKAERDVHEGSLLELRAVTEYDLDIDPFRIGWNSTAMNDLRRGIRYSFDTSALRVSAYRPFCKQNVYFEATLNERQYQLRHIFPTPTHENIGIYQVGAGSAVPFSVLMTDAIPDLHLTGAGSGGQYFPRWTWEPVEEAGEQASLALPSAAGDVIVDGYRRFDNINPATVEDYRVAYGSSVTADDVFHYVYGLLHSPYYRAEFAADLKKMLPRIPKVASAEDFRAIVDGGRALADLHVGYESVDPYPLTVTGDVPSGPGSGDLYDWFRVEKMRFAGAGLAKDRSSVVYNPRITVSGIPEEAHEYLLGSRSGVEWVMERYRVKTDKPSGIVNDPNDWSREVGDPRYVLDLLQRVVTVSVETVRIVKALPPLDLSTLT